MIDIPFNEGKFLITSLDQNVKNRNRHLSRIKMIWSGQERQKQVVDFEEGEGVTSRSNCLFFLFYLILRFCNVWYKPNFQNLTGIVGSGGKCTIFFDKNLLCESSSEFLFFQDGHRRIWWRTGERGRALRLWCILVENCRNIAYIRYPLYEQCKNTAGMVLII